MQNHIFEVALGLTAPWFIQGGDFDAGRKTLAIQVTFVAGSRFTYPGI